MNNSSSLASSGMGSYYFFFFFSCEWAILSCFFVCFIIFFVESYTFYLGNFGNLILPLLRDGQFQLVEGWNHAFVTSPNYSGKVYIPYRVWVLNFQFVTSAVTRWPDKGFHKCLYFKRRKTKNTVFLISLTEFLGSSLGHDSETIM